MKKIVTFLVLVSIAVSCKSASTTVDNSKETSLLKAEKWILVELYGKKVVSTEANRPYYIMFAEGKNQFSAWIGCNSMGGEYLMESNGKFSFSKTMSTMMACTDMEDEGKFGKMLSEVDNMTINGNTMSFNKARMAPLARFEKVTNEQNLAALSGNYEVDYIGEPGFNFDESFKNNKPTLILDIAAMKASGNGGCNNYHTSFKVDGNNINFKLPASTKMGCPGNGEAVFFKTLTSINKYSLDGNTLTMMVDDVVMLRLRKS